MNTATNNDVLAALTSIAREIAACRGNLSSFAYSPDRVDQYVAEGLRSHCKALAAMVAHDVDLADRTAVALAWACMGDEYAVKELGGRFKSVCARMRLTAAIRKHPRAGTFATLIRAIESGKFSKPQIELARKLAAEVNAV